MRESCAWWCANLRGEVAELRRCAAWASSRVPHLASVSNPPGVRRASWQCRWLLANTLPRREASDSSVGRRPPAAVSAEEAVQARGCAWVRGARSASVGARRWGTSRQGRRRHARGARRGSRGVGGTWAAVGRKWKPTQQQVGGGSGAGAGAVLLVRGQAAVRVRQASRGTSGERVARTAGERRGAQEGGDGTLMGKLQ